MNDELNPNYKQNIDLELAYNIGALSQSGMRLETIRNFRTAQALNDDFLEWLFEKSGHINIPFSKAWDEFENYNDE